MRAHTTTAVATARVAEERFTTLAAAAQRDASDVQHLQTTIGQTLPAIVAQTDAIAKQIGSLAVHVHCVRVVLELAC